jgi:hypothetical protein
MQTQIQRNRCNTTGYPYDKTDDAQLEPGIDIDQKFLDTSVQA